GGGWTLIAKNLCSDEAVGGSQDVKMVSAGHGEKVDLRIRRNARHGFQGIHIAGRALKHKDGSPDRLQPPSGSGQVEFALIGSVERMKLGWICTDVGHGAEGKNGPKTIGAFGRQEDQCAPAAMAAEVDALRVDETLPHQKVGGGQDVVHLAKKAFP